MFLDEHVDIQRFDILKYPAIDKMMNNMQNIHTVIICNAVKVLFSANK